VILAVYLVQIFPRNLFGRIYLAMPWVGGIRVRSPDGESFIVGLLRGFLAKEEQGARSKACAELTVLIGFEGGVKWLTDCNREKPPE